MRREEGEGSHSQNQPQQTTPAGERKTSLLAHVVGTKGAVTQIPTGFCSRQRKPPRQRADVTPRRGKPAPSTALTLLQSPLDGPSRGALSG